MIIYLKKKDPSSVCAFPVKCISLALYLRAYTLLQRRGERLMKWSPGGAREWISSRRRRLIKTSARPRDCPRRRLALRTNDTLAVDRKKRPSPLIKIDIVLRRRADVRLRPPPLPRADKTSIGRGDG